VVDFANTIVLTAEQSKSAGMRALLAREVLDLRDESDASQQTAKRFHALTQMALGLDCSDSCEKRARLDVDDDV